MGEKTAFASPKQVNELKVLIYGSKKSRKEVAEEMGLSYAGLTAKLSGYIRMTLDEAEKIKKICK